MKRICRRFNIGTKIIVLIGFSAWLVLLGFIEIINSNSEDVRIMKTELLRREREKNDWKNSHEQVLQKSNEENVVNFNFPDEDNSDDLDVQEKLMANKIEMKKKILEKISDFNRNKEDRNRKALPDAHKNSDPIGNIKLNYQAEAKIPNKIFLKAETPQITVLQKQNPETAEPENNLVETKVESEEVEDSKEKESFNDNVLPTPEEIKEIPGDMGKGVDLPSNLSQNVAKLVEEGWRLHEFNQYVSDLIPVQRNLLDYRDDYCKQEGLYLKDLPKTSVIIIFHNEAWSTLLRTVHSVLNRSPDHLLAEIILVDDFSDMRKLWFKTQKTD